MNSIKLLSTQTYSSARVRVRACIYIALVCRKAILCGYSYYYVLLAGIMCYRPVLNLPQKYIIRPRLI